MKTKRFLVILLSFAMLLGMFNFPITSQRAYAEELDPLMASGGKNDVKAFVTRLYEICLDREPDNQGLNDWTSQLKEKRATGTSVAYGFFTSKEFLDKKTSNKQYMTYMYKALLGRKPDTDGLNYWIAQLKSGKTREEVFCEFTESTEFSNLCSKYGIVKGSHVAGSDYIKTAQVNLFVERLYNEILDRNCDNEGMAYWTKLLVSKEMSGGEVAYGFLFSDEFLNKHLCNKHYTEVLYKALLGRKSDSTGRSYWVSLLKKKTTREEVFKGFLSSNEFNEICNSYGIKVGTVKTTGKTYENGECVKCKKNPDPTGEDPDPTGEDPDPTGEDPDPTGEDPDPTGEDPDPLKYVTYEQFGAKGDGKTDDYEAIVKAHEYANANKLPVKAKSGATYYVCKMNPKNPQGALIKTDTDWTGAKFIIDDSKLSLGTGETKCFLFSIVPSIEFGPRFINFSADNSLTLGVDNALFTCPTSIVNDNTTNVPRSIADKMKNKAFPAGTTKLEGKFDYKALYVIQTPSYKRWGRFGDGSANAPARNQSEVIVVNKDGTIDSCSPIEWNWKDIDHADVYYVDETELKVTGGTFTTIVNTLSDVDYVYRSINVNRSNVVIDGVEHYLTGEDYSGDDLPRVGAPYHGFLRLQCCAYVTIKNCVFSEHKCVYYKPGDNRTRTAPYDFYAEYSCGITLENCKSATDINDGKRWGLGTNFCKCFTFDNCTFSRIDAHKGMYNLTVKNSTLGYYSVAAIGFGDLKIENTESYGDDAFLTFREDFGCAWFGNVYIKDCTWHCKTYSPTMIKAMNFHPKNDYAFDFDGKYYVHMASNINIDGFTLDVSTLGTSSDAALYNTQYFQIFSKTYSSNGQDPNLIFNETFLKDPTKNVYPIKPPEKVTLKNFKVIKNANYKNKTLKVVLVRDPNNAYNSNFVREDWYFYKDTKFEYDSASTVETWK